MLVEMTEYLVKSLVTDKEAVTVKEFPTDDENEMIIEVMVNQDDMGKVIGKNGKIIDSIRTLVQAASSIEANKRVRINVSSY